MALSVLDHDLSEQAVSFPIGAGGEDQLVGLGGVPVAELQAPEAVDDDWPAVRPSQLTQVRARCRSGDVDVAVPEVADQQIPAELAESGRRLSETPWRVERATGDKTADERAVVAEHIHESMTRPGDIVVPHRVLLGERHIQFAADLGDAERP